MKELDEVARDLETVARKARRFSEFRDLDLPSLDTATAELELDRHGLAALLASARERIVDPDYRGAVTALFPFPYEDNSWPTFLARIDGEGYTSGKKRDKSTPEHCVADYLGSEYKNLNKANKAGRTRLDDLYSEYARAILDEVDARQESLPSPDRSGRHRVLMPALAAVILLCGALLMVVLLRSSRDPVTPSRGASASEAEPADPCAAEVGALNSALEEHESASEIREGLRQAARRAGGSSVVGCARATAVQWKSMVTQELHLDGQPNGALLVVIDDPTRSFWLNRALWGSYHQMYDEAAFLSGDTGAPVRIVELEDRVEVELESGTILVAESENAPYFWIGAPFVDWWRDHSEVGLPTSRPDRTSLRQDSTNGYATVDVGLTNPVFHPQPDAHAALPPPAARQGRMLRQRDGTAWLITDEDTRLWIADVETYDCLGGDESIAANGLDGAAIATLRYAGIAECP